MATDNTFIDVYLFIPRTANDWDDMKWVHTLHIPINNLVLLSLRPYKHLRYMCFCLLAAFGELSFSDTSSKITVPYDTTAAEFPRTNRRLYYHLDRGPVTPQVFPVDPDMENSVTTISSSNGRSASFRNQVMIRDGGWCVFVRTTQCVAAHLVRCSKGDAYVERLTTQRSVNHPEPVIVSEVNDVRNGLSLNLCIHDKMGKAVAFLPVPNIYMASTDVVANHNPGERLCVLHDFQPLLEDLVQRLTVPQVGHARISARDWPPTILLEAFYAITLLRSWGVNHYGSHVIPAWKEDFHGAQPIYTWDGRARGRWKKASQEADLREENIRKRDARYARQNEASEAEPDPWDFLLAVQDMIKGDTAYVDKEDVEPQPTKRRHDVEDKVQKWLESTV